jgi:Tfp pilus assembly protein FimV
MQMILILLPGLGIGALVGWLWANAKSKSELATYKIQSEGNPRAGETMISDLHAKQAELRGELEIKNQELSGLQQQRRAEGEQKAAAPAEPRPTRASLEELYNWLGTTTLKQLPMSG